MTPGEIANATEELGSAQEALSEARLLLSEEMLEGATSRLYYAVFHAAGAALTVRSLYARTHSGRITLFESTYGPAPILGRLLEWRLEADYRKRSFHRTTEDLTKAAEEAGSFVDRCREIVSAARVQGPDEPDDPPDI